MKNLSGEIILGRVILYGRDRTSIKVCAVMNQITTDGWLTNHLPAAARVFTGPDIQPGQISSRARYSAGPDIQTGQISSRARYPDGPDIQPGQMSSRRDIQPGQIFFEINGLRKTVKSNFLHQFVDLTHNLSSFDASKTNTIGITR